MIGRTLFLIFFLLGGFIVVIPYWILFGTKAHRERKRLMRQNEQMLRRQGFKA